MKTPLPYVTMIRPANAVMTAAAVILGAWLSHGFSDIRAVVLLALAAMSAVGYGNVVNDIRDIGTDRVSHPNRPLPRKQISVETAIIFAFFLFSFALVNAFMVSPAHGLAVAAPLVLLTLYAFFFKATPFAGNLLVSLLVAYPLVFGGLTAPGMPRLLIPAILAFLLNMAREIVKDIQDEPGDRGAGLTTTASAPKGALMAVVLTLSVAYCALLFVPFFLKQFGMVYAVLCAVLALPIHGIWSVMFARHAWFKLPAGKQIDNGISRENAQNGGNGGASPDKQLGKISLLIKIELLMGLLALTADQLLGA
jgi:geranylgeranylglycerol-phosphate geranylgeranyltransferase